METLWYQEGHPRNVKIITKHKLSIVRDRLQCRNDVIRKDTVEL